MIKVLSLILFLLLVIIGKSRGLKTFMLFYSGLILIMIYILGINLGLNAIIFAIIMCIIISLVTLFGLNGYNTKTKASFLSILVVLFIITLIMLFVGKNSNIEGFSVEDIENIGAFSYDINYNMTNCIIGAFIISIIGTVIDTSISVSSAMNEIYENNKKISRKELFKSGMNVGKDILSTTINTLFFAVIIFYIGFFLWHENANLGYVINYKAFVSETIKLLMCFIGSILIIPITSYIFSRLIIKKQ